MTWPTVEAREAVPCTRVCSDSGRGMRHTSGCDEHRDAILAALAPHVTALVRAERADAWEEGYDVGHRYARRVLPPDESDANPYAEAPDA